MKSLIRQASHKNPIIIIAYLLLRFCCCDFNFLSFISVFRTMCINAKCYDLHLAGKNNSLAFTRCSWFWRIRGGGATRNEHKLRFAMLVNMCSLFSFVCLNNFISDRTMTATTMAIWILRKTSHDVYAKVSLSTEWLLMHEKKQRSEPIRTHLLICFAYSFSVSRISTSNVN